MSIAVDDSFYQVMLFSMYLFKLIEIIYFPADPCSLINIIAIMNLIIKVYIIQIQNINVGNTLQFTRNHYNLGNPAAQSCVP